MGRDCSKTNCKLRTNWLTQPKAAIKRAEAEAKGSASIHFKLLSQKFLQLTDHKLSEGGEAGWEGGKNSGKAQKQKNQISSKHRAPRSVQLPGPVVLHN